MRNLLLVIRFNGSAYHGYQVQANARSVAQTFQDAVEAVVGRRDPVTGCSRTDAGVHANRYCVG
jgi:tRNA pseudouridine38-40 synthase